MKITNMIYVAGLVLASCAPPPEPAPAPEVQTQSAAVISVTQTPGQTAAFANSKPVTVSGGSGSTCLAVDVLANDGAFIRAGTAGSLSGDVFTVNGVSHDISGINYSTKSC